MPVASARPIDTSSSLLDNDQIRSAVANRAVDELFANVDVQAELEAQLPADDPRIGDRLINARGESVAEKAAFKALVSEFEKNWPQIIERAKKGA